MHFWNVIFHGCTKISFYCLDYNLIIILLVLVSGFYIFDSHLIFKVCKNYNLKTPKVRIDSRIRKLQCTPEI